QHYLVLWGQEGSLAEDLPGRLGMLRRGQIRMRARGARRGELEHLRAQGGEREILARHVGSFEFVQVSDDLGVWLLVGGRRLGVSYADAEEEAAWVLPRDSVIRRCDRSGLVGPHVHDPG